MSTSRRGKWNTLVKSNQPPTVANSQRKKIEIGELFRTVNSAAVDHLRIKQAQVIRPVFVYGAHPCSALSPSQSLACRCMECSESRRETNTLRSRSARMNSVSVFFAQTIYFLVRDHLASRRKWPKAVERFCLPFFPQEDRPGLGG